MSNQEQLKSQSLTNSPPMGSTATLLLFGAAALLLFVATHLVIPALAARMRAEPVLLWFLAGGLGVFTPLFAIAVVMLRGLRNDASAHALADAVHSAVSCPTQTKHVDRRIDPCGRQRPRLRGSGIWTRLTNRTPGGRHALRALCALCD
jgi:hypothetical protein